TNFYYGPGVQAGLLQQSVDLGRSVTHAPVYDAYLRVATNSASGSLPEHTQVTAFEYDARGLITNYVETSAVNPTTIVRRRYDGYGQVTNETVLIGGVQQNEFSEKWDAAGRRSRLKSSTAQFDYSYRVDGELTFLSAFGSDYNFTYGDNGLLASRS